MRPGVGEQEYVRCGRIAAEPCLVSTQWQNLGIGFALDARSARGAHAISLPRVMRVSSALRGDRWCGARTRDRWRSRRVPSLSVCYVRIARPLPRASRRRSRQRGARRVAGAVRGARNRTCQVVARELGCGPRGHSRVCMAGGVLTPVAAVKAARDVCESLRSVPAAFAAEPVSLVGQQSRADRECGVRTLTGREVRRAT